MPGVGAATIDLKVNPLATLDNRNRGAVIPALKPIAWIISKIHNVR